MKRHKLAAVLRRNGLVEYPGRGKGGDTWFEHPDDPTKATTVPGHNEIKVGTLSSILRYAGKSRKEYQERLLEM